MLLTISSLISYIDDLVFQLDSFEYVKLMWAYKCNVFCRCYGSHVTAKIEFSELMLIQIGGGEKCYLDVWLFRIGKET